jgi:hypothetical protein
MNYQTIGPEHKHEHTEHHKSHSEVLRDAIIGFADGLTVPFALTAGLSAYVHFQHHHLAFLKDY